MRFVCFIVLLCSVMRTGCLNEKKTTPTFGPFKTTLIRIDKCEKTTYPIDKDPPLLVYVGVYNSTKKNFLMRGNLTAMTEQVHIKLKVKGYIWRSGKWKITHLMNNIGCHGMLLHIFMASVGIKYDRETCSLIKGKYSFSEIDVDSIQHIMTTKMEYGRILWTTEVLSRSTTFCCWEFETLVQPLDKT